ncbi:MAG: hypothetical protein WC429_04700 [Verrucomicrobiia bacterium]
MIKKLTAGMVLVLSLAAIPAGAIPINITMLGNTPVIAAPASQLSDFGDTAVFNWLKADVAAFNTSQGTSYPVPTALPNGSPLSKTETFSGSSSFTMTMPSDQYAFLHWGGKDGGWAQAYYNSGATADYVFNAPPGGAPLVGGISFYSSYGSSGGGGGSVPEGGVTIGLLGMAMGGLVLMRKQ